MKRFIPSLSLSITIALFWLLLTSSISIDQIIMALILAFIVPLFAARLDREFAQIGQLHSVPKMCCILIWDIILSNIEVATLVLGPEKNITPGFIWVPLDIANIHGIAALTSIITLTPGTVSALLSDDRKFLLVHVFNLKDEQVVIDSIKRRYEKPLMEIFP